MRFSTFFFNCMKPSVLRNNADKSLCALQFPSVVNILQNCYVSQPGHWHWYNPLVLFRFLISMCVFSSVQFYHLFGSCIHHHHSQDSEQLQHYKSPIWYSFIIAPTSLPCLLPIPWQPLIRPPFLKLHHSKNTI